MPARARTRHRVGERLHERSGERRRVARRHGLAEVVLGAQLGEGADGGHDGRHALGQRGREHARALDPAVGERDHARSPDDRGHLGLGHEAQIPGDQVVDAERVGALAQGLDRHARAADDVERHLGHPPGDLRQGVDQAVQPLVRPDQPEEEDARLGDLAAGSLGGARRAGARGG